MLNMSIREMSVVQGIVDNLENRFESGSPRPSEVLDFMIGVVCPRGMAFTIEVMGECMGIPAVEAGIYWHMWLRHVA